MTFRKMNGFKTIIGVNGIIMIIEIEIKITVVEVKDISLAQDNIMGLEVIQEIWKKGTQETQGVLVLEMWI